MNVTFRTEHHGTDLSVSCSVVDFRRLAATLYIQVYGEEEYQRLLKWQLASCLQDHFGSCHPEFTGLESPTNMPPVPTSIPDDPVLYGRIMIIQGMDTPGELEKEICQWVVELMDTLESMIMHKVDQEQFKLFQEIKDLLTRCETSVNVC